MWGPAAAVLLVLNAGGVAGFCNWGPDGTGTTSTCSGGAQGGNWCNANKAQCVESCGGKWCGYCNWGPDGTKETSVCSGDPQGGEWCNANEAQCNACNGRWCTFAPEETTPEDGCPAGWLPATWTTYTSYAPCCTDSPNYDPAAPSEECDLYSACEYTGDFAYIGHKSFSYVQSTNLVAFFTSNGGNSGYGNKEIRVRAAGKEVTALIADTCGDNDCNGCCTANAQPSGNLVDMEYWTVVREFGSATAAHGQICWQLV